MLDYCPLPDIKEWHEHAPSWAKSEREEKGAIRKAERAFAAALAAAGREAQLDTGIQPLKERFARLANEWSRETSHMSSASDLTNNPAYQQIIKLGWPVIPHLLDDLERNKRFWFPALAAITGLRPFDPSDASNYRRMTAAWLLWGKRKGFI